MSGNCGNCSGCSGCDQSLTLTEGELEMLQKLGQIPFLPIARRGDSLEPVYLEDTGYPPEETSLILQCLEKKGLISLDYDQPLLGFSDPRYSAYPIQGSMALTARGQQVLDLLERNGIDAEC